jgi:mannan endo-1,4-beta-mannosidase
MKKVILSILSMIFISFSGEASTTGFVSQRNGQFFLQGKPYYYIGTNYWYGAILGSKGQGGNRKQLLRDLNFMKSQGIVNLRVLVGADGPDGQDVKVRPSLQTAPGVYNDTILDGLDFFLSELGKRGMHAVLFLNNSWEWSGGYGQYLSWSGKGGVPKEGVRDWPKFVKHVAQYADCEPCHELFFNHVKYILSRTNRYTKKKYVNDPAIMSWQVGNEPRAFSDGAKPHFIAWLKKATALIRSMDSNHLISLGNEGLYGCEMDMNLFEQIHSDPNVSYLTIHIWPKNWSWIDSKNVVGTLDSALVKTDDYIQKHTIIAQKLKKPIVVEEFGYPRDHHKYTLDDSTIARDRYYENIFQHVARSAKTGGILAGCNFWAWGGFSRPSHTYWKLGDDYVGDPAQEEQGLNSVFDSDTTMELIKKDSDMLMK